MENKPTNQSAQIQEEKDRVAKKHGHKDWMSIHDNTKRVLLMNEVILEYSSSQLEAKNAEIEQWQKDYSDLQNRNIELKSQLSQATAQSKSVNPLAQEVDVERLADAYMKEIGPNAEWKGFIDGYNQALQSKAVGYSLDINAGEIVNGYCTLYQLRSHDLLSDFASYFLSEIKNQSLTPTPIQTKGREVEKDIGKSVCEHEWTLMADSFDSPYCKKCGKIS